MELLKSYQTKSSIPLLTSGFVIIIVLVVIFAITALQQNKEIAELNEKMYTHPFTVSNTVLEINAGILAMHRSMKDVVLSNTNGELELAVALVNDQEQKIYQHFELIRERFLGRDDIINLAYGAFVDWKGIRGEVISLSRKGDHKLAALITKNKGAQHVQLLTEQMNVLIDFARNKAFEFQQRSQLSSIDSIKNLVILLTFFILSGIITAIFVIRQTKKAEIKLQLSARVLSNSHEGVMITDSNKLIIDINPAFCEITGYSREDTLGKNPRMLSSDKQDPDFYKEMWLQIKENDHWHGEVWNRKKGGEIFAELLSISVLKDKHDRVVNYVGIFSDITRSKQHQEELRLMAHYDVLTKLPNRALFIDRFHQAIAHSSRTGKQLAVCFLDLDNFKPVNDNYGHAAGDKLLVEVANRIKACIREEDTVSRQGGDEFALLLNDIDSSSQCERTMERIHQALAAPYFIDEIEHHVTASSGATLYPSDDDEIDTLLRHADQAMYQAKLEGKHRYQFFDPDSDQLIIQKNHKLEEIKQALVNNEFQLYFQPKVNMVTGAVFGAEALIRWLSPEKGLIPPLDFLPFIENTVLEIEVGKWVIATAIQQLNDWQQQGIKLEVSINISSNHLLSDSFIESLEAEISKRPSIDSKYLQIEILESSALGDLDAITHIIQTCQNQLGISFSLDDFGTGYSSLTHLRSLPAKTIKVDQSFVRDMLDDPNDYAIIEGVIGLAKSFNREVIAEGVETTMHGGMLLLMGCEQAQGYGVSKPMPATDFPQWLDNYIPNKEWLICATKQRSHKEKSLKIFEMVNERWACMFIEHIASSSDKVTDWPILDAKYCHCGNWIERKKQDQLFEVEGMRRLEQAHDDVHLIAQAIKHKYRLGDVEAARADLAEFQLAIDNMSNMAGLCE